MIRGLEPDRARMVESVRLFVRYALEDGVSAHAVRAAVLEEIRVCRGDDGFREARLRVERLSRAGFYDKREAA